MKRILSVPALLLLFLFVGVSPAKAQVQIPTAYTSGPLYIPLSAFPATLAPHYILISLYNSNSYPVSLTDVSTLHIAEADLGGGLTLSNNGATYSLLYSNSSLTGAPTAITTWPLVGNSAPIYTTTNAVIPVITGLNFQIPPATEYRFALVTNDTLIVRGGKDINGVGNPPLPFTFTNAGVTLTAVNPANTAGKVQFGTYPNTPVNSADTIGWEGIITFQRTGPIVVITNNFSCEGGDITLTANVPSTVTGATVNWTGPGGRTHVGATWTLTNVDPSYTGTYTANYTVTGPQGNETSTKTEAVVTVNPTPAPPVLSGRTKYCTNEQFEAITAAGQNILWYTNATGGTGTTLAPYVNTTIAGSFTFYATQTVNNCESKLRTPIVITVAPKPQPPVVTTPIGYCEAATSAPLSAIGDDLLWYYDPVGGLPSVNPPTPNTSVRDSFIYYVSQTVQGCESDRARIDVIISFTPNGLILVSRNPEICRGDTLTFGYYGSAVTNTAYNWLIPQTDAELLSGIPGTSGPLVIRFTNPGIYRVGLNTGNVGCYSELYSQPIRVKGIPDGSIVVKDNICKLATELVSLSTYTPTIDTFIWNFGGGTATHFSTDQGPYGVYWKEPGEHIISLIVTDELCRDTVYDTVMIHDLPDAKINGYVQGTIICTSDSMKLQANTIEPASQYVWSPSRFFDNYNTLPVTYARVDFDSKVKLQVTDEYGCVNSDSVAVKTKLCCDIAMPSAFTPNSDGRNDVFRIISPGDLNLASFRIVNRWGQVVFETADPRVGWDGNMNGKPQDMGSYAYSIRYKCANKNTEQHGELTLIR
jgi:gliding motility-associated-like protein